MATGVAGTQIEMRNGDPEGLKPLGNPDHEYWARMAEADKASMQKLLQDAFRPRPLASRA